MSALACKCDERCYTCGCACHPWYWQTNEAYTQRIAALEAQVAYEREERIAAGAWCEQAKIAEERVAALVDALRLAQPQVKRAMAALLDIGMEASDLRDEATAVAAVDRCLSDLPAAAEAYRQRVRREALEEVIRYIESDDNTTAAARIANRVLALAATPPASKEGD